MANTNGNNKKHFNSAPRKSREEYAAEKAAQLAKQSKSLDIISDVTEYLENFIKNGETFKISMKEILTYLNETKGHSIDDTKVISQFNYLLMELANARKNNRISGDRLNIRVLYIQERFKTSFKSELHERITDIMKKYDVMFKWDATSTGTEYNTISAKD